MTDETYNTLEDVTRNLLTQIEELDIGTKDGKEALTKAVHLTELLISADRDSADYYDKKERRRIDEDRNKAMAEIENNKQKLTSGRVIFEMAKLLVPMGVSLVGYSIFQRRVLQFEETGRITSTAGRELHLPKWSK